jgi:hypothetical protein
MIGGLYTQAVEEDTFPRSLRWRDWSGFGLEHALLSEEAGNIEVRSAVISGPVRSGFVALYSLKLSPDWYTTELQGSLLGTSECVYLRRTEESGWFDENNRSLPDLNGMFDVDLSITPLTNTLPIRRLRLAIGESADVETAYVLFPQLTISRDSQRYTRVASNQYRYESLDRDFIRELTVDDNGLVITYPGLFQRIE